MWRSNLAWRQVIGLLAVAFVVIGPAPIAVAVEKAVVTDVRVGARAAETRFVLELTERVAFDTFTLDGPYRLVIDMSEVGWRLPAQPLPAGIGLLRRLRYGLYKPGTTRIVLDLSGPAEVRSAFLLEPSGKERFRVVVDLAATSPQAFAATLRARQPGATRSIDSTLLPAAAPTVNQSAPLATLFPLPPRKPERHWKKRIVVLDPGHGGIDPGASGTSKIREKSITLAFAKEASKKLEATGRYRVVLTRDRDTFIRLRDRIAIARRAGAELFISLHADSIRDRRVRGLSVYTLSERASDREAAALAESENKADLIAGVDLTGETAEVTNILIDLAQRETMNQSARFASGLVGELSQETRLLRNTHRFAGFVVLKAPDVPSVLVEMGFLSNRRDEKALQDRAYRGKLANAIVRAVDNYFDQVEQATRQ